MVNLQFGKKFIKDRYTQSKRLISSKCTLPVAFASSIVLDQLLAYGRHDQLQKLCLLLINGHFKFAHFYIAKSYFLQYRLDCAIKHIDLFLDIHHHHEDALYLKAQILIEQGCVIQARNLLHSMLLWSSRGKTWQLLADLVRNPDDFYDYLQLLNKFYTDLDDLPYDIANHVTHAAYLADCVDFALQLWKKKYAHDLARVNLKQKPPSKKYSQKAASIALKDLKCCLNNANIEFFLISGTLLGCIREGALLGHDKDIDVGVWQKDVDVQELVVACRTSGLFYILPSSNDELVVVRHVNGTTIDIFMHKQDSEGVWHFGGKCKWFNTPFNLTTRAFLDDEYLIPTDYNLYLTENYGPDWQIPKIDFDSALDTPNMHITDPKKMLIYLYKKLSSSSMSPSLSSRMAAQKDLLLQK